MKLYRGERKAGGTVATVDGRPLDPRRDLRDFRAGSFEWGYEGSGPSQLALAILADLKGPTEALKHYKSFLRTVIAELDGDTWQLKAAEIERRLTGTVEVPMDLATLLRKVRGEG
ncbi:MAG: hypothetical protein FJX68_13260 [Alphaproteobacteria bacterium]|nr:hypothetical protein [Alphaproteobacteria bacterium]